MKVFYRLEMSCTEANSFSPSAGKPAQAVADWLKHSLITNDDIMSFEPLRDTQIGIAHSLTYVHCIMSGEFENGFGNKSLAVAESLRYTTGSMLAAAEYAVLHKEHVCSPTSGFHHASANEAAGFCTFNGLMIAAMTLQEQGLAHKIGILDIDRHYGDGTDSIIRSKEVSGIVHRTFGAAFHSRHDCEDGAFEAWLEKACHAMRGCDVVLYQAGADPHINDPLGRCLTTEQMRLRDAYVFNAFKGKPLVWNLAGGYQKTESGSIEPVLELHRNTMKEALNVSRNPSASEGHQGAVQV